MSVFRPRPLHALVALFVLTLPLMNPWVRGDGVEYYAYVRAIIIQHNLRFENDWRASNSTFTEGRVDQYGHVAPDQYTRTGYVQNMASIGASLLWSPFFIGIDEVVRAVDNLGARVPRDGFSRPYLWTAAFATALYGFAGLLFAYSLARTYFSSQCSAWATVGIWWATSLPVYMYFNPFWSHAHSVFAVGLFLWFWNRTRGERNVGRWFLLGLSGGLMIDVYYLNGVMLLVPLVESLRAYWHFIKPPLRNFAKARRLLLSNMIFVAAILAALLPTLITRQILWGSMLQTGYPGAGEWNWRHPALLRVLFSSDHGLLSWTPILIPALLGLFFLRKFDREMALCFGMAFVAFYLVICSYPAWDGISSFGGRMFISMTPIFVVGLTATLHEIAERFSRRRWVVFASAPAILLLIFWNLGFMFQWGMHLVPPRGPISWRQMTYNQVLVVPARAVGSLKEFAFRRSSLMNRIEKTDREQIKTGDSPH